MNEITENKLSKLEGLEISIIRECRIQAQSIASTGKHLKEIRDGEEYTARGFASFAEYMEDACGKIFPFRSSQAYKYIRVWEAYGPRLEQYGGIALDILDMFKYENPDDFAELAEKNDLERMSVKEAAELKKQLEKATEQISFLTEEKENAEKELNELKSKPVEVAVAEPSEEDKARFAAEAEKKFSAEAKELKDKLSKAEKEAESYRKKLEKKDKASEKQRSEMAEDYKQRLKELDDALTSEKANAEKQINELEKKLRDSSGKADEELIEYKFYFEQVKANLEKFIGVLKNISDAGKKKKFKDGALKFINAIKADIDAIEEKGE